MHQLISTILFISILQTMVIFDFSENSDLAGWYIVNDNVMGGKSQGTFELNSNGNGFFKGAVSLENNGGFSSVHYRFPRKDIGNAKILVLKVKGDGKRYQARIYASTSDYFSYIAYFETSGEWQTIEIPLENMYPSFRGRKIDRPNFSEQFIEEIAILIGNKKAEPFELEIQKVFLK